MRGFLSVTNCTMRKYAKEAVEFYKQGRGVTWIAKTLKIDRTTVRHAIKDEGILLRHRSSSYYSDKDFFSRSTPEAAYWAGFIMADGYVRRKNCISIKLDDRDRDHLFKFLRAIKSEGHPVGRGLPHYSYVNVWSPWLVKDLEEMYGIVNRKSLTAKFPKKIPRHLVSHFIRGYLDGDGCISYGAREFSCNFIGTEDLLDNFREIFFQELGITLKSGNRVPPLYQTPTTKEIFLLKYTCQNTCKILDWLYKDSTSDTRLDRKYDRYKKILEYYRKRKTMPASALSFKL